MKVPGVTFAIFLILSIPGQAYPEEESRSSSFSEPIRVSPVSATCPYAKKKYMVDMDGAASGAWSRKEPEKAKSNAKSKTDQKARSRSRAKSVTANKARRDYEEMKIEEARRIHKEMEWQAKIKNAEDWCRKHCNFVLKVREKIIEGIDSIKRRRGEKYVLINGEEYIDKGGEFVKLKETPRDK